MQRIEVTSFVRPDVIPQLADARRCSSSVRLPDRRSVGVLIPNERGLERALALRDRFQEINGFLSASETHNQKNVGRPVAESLAGLERDVRAGTGRGTAVRGRDLDLVRLPVRGACAGRAGARRSPRRWSRPGASRSGSATRPGWPTRCRCASFFAAARDGCRGGADRALPQHPRTGPRQRAGGARGGGRELRVLASASSAVPGAGRARPGNIATEDLVSMLHEMGISTGIDLAALIAGLARGAARAGPAARQPRAARGARVVGGRRADRGRARRSAGGCGRAGAAPGVPSATASKARRRASCPCASGSRGSWTPARSPRRGCWPGGRRTARRRGCRDRGRHGRRRARRGDGQRPDGQGRVVGAEDRREDRADPGAGAVTADPARLPGRLGRRADQRAGADVPRAPRRRQDLLQPGADVRASCRRCASCSVPAPPAAPTSPRSATS